jgi:glc operon protein GlcG
MRPRQSQWLIPPAICLLSSEWLVSAPASADLAIEKARTAARLQRPTAEIEDNINRGRTAFVTAGIAALRGGVPIRVNGEVVGAVGVAGLSKEIDAEIANTATAALSPLPKTDQRR